MCAKMLVCPMDKVRHQMSNRSRGDHVIMDVNYGPSRPTKKGKRAILGDCGHTDQVSKLHTDLHDMGNRGIEGAVHQGSRMIARDTHKCSIKFKSQV